MNLLSTKYYFSLNKTKVIVCYNALVFNCREPENGTAEIESNIEKSTKL